MRRTRSLSQNYGSGRNQDGPLTGNTFETFQLKIVKKIETSGKAKTLIYLRNFKFINEHLIF